MAVLLAIVLAAFHLENDDFFALDKRVHNFNYYFRATYSRCAHCDSAFLVYEKNLVKFNSLAFLYIFEAVDEELLALFDLELLTVNFYDCVHFN